MKDTLHNIHFFELHDVASPVRYERFAVPASARSADMAFPAKLTLRGAPKKDFLQVQSFSHVFFSCCSFKSHIRSLHFEHPHAGMRQRLP